MTTQLPEFTSINDAKEAHEFLVQNIQSIEVQLSSRKADMMNFDPTSVAYGSYLSWRSRALRAKKHLRNELVAAKNWIREYNLVNGGLMGLLSRVDSMMHEKHLAGELLSEIHNYLGVCAVLPDKFLAQVVQELTLEVDNTIVTQ